MLRDCDDQDICHAFNVYQNRGFNLAGYGLNCGFEPVVVGNTDDSALIIDSDQESSARGVGKCAELTPKVTGTRTLEFQGISFTQGNKLFQVFLSAH